MKTTITITTTTTTTKVAVFATAMALITVHCANESEEFIGDLYYLQEKIHR